MRIINKPSPNQSDRIHGQEQVRLVICHTPEGSDAGAISTIMNPNADVSYHRLYLDGGQEAIQFVDFKKKAWHGKAYNSLSDGLACSGYARRFDLREPEVKAFARGVAERLVARKLRPQWTTNPAKGGFCRHGDIQSDRTDPTPDLAEWRLFVGMVESEYQRLTRPADKKPWPVPVPPWYWQWAAWKLGVRPDRPKDAPKRIPTWAWTRLRYQKGIRDV
jgi:hypothetical protein